MAFVSIDIGALASFWNNDLFAKTGSDSRIMLHRASAQKQSRPRGRLFAVLNF
jgi:hypothetical protein